MSDGEAVTLQRLGGGTKWHCPGVACRYVAAADLSLSGERQEVYWDGERVRASDDDEPVTLANVCNHCQHQLGWTGATERFAAVRRRHGTDSAERGRRWWHGED